MQKSFDRINADVHDEKKVELFPIGAFSSSLPSIDTLQRMLASDLNGLAYKGPAVSGKTTLIQAAIDSTPNDREMFPIIEIHEAFVFDESLIKTLG